MKSTQTSGLARATAILFLTAVSLTLACTSTPTVPDDVTVATVAMAVEPDPVSAQASINPEFDFAASFTAVMTETAGVGITVNDTIINVTEIPDNQERGEIFETVVGVEIDRIEANERVQIPIHIVYTLPEGRSEARIDVTLSMTDDNGYNVGGILQVVVR